MITDITIDWLTLILVYYWPLLILHTPSSLVIAIAGHWILPLIAFIEYRLRFHYNSHWCHWIRHYHFIVLYYILPYIRAIIDITIIGWFLEYIAGNNSHFSRPSLRADCNGWQYRVIETYQNVIEYHHFFRITLIE